MKILSASPTWNVLLALAALLLPSGVSPVPATPAHAAPQQSSAETATAHAYGRPAAELYSSVGDQSLPQIDQARRRLERDGRVLRSRFITVDFDALGGAGFDAAQPSIELAPRLALTLFGDRVTVMQERVDLNPAGGFSWIGWVEGEPDSRVVLAVNAGNLSGGITLRGLTFQISPVADGLHVLSELSAAYLPSDLPPIPFVGPPAPRNASDMASNVDLLVVYTPKTESDLGGRDATHSFIQQAVSTVNARLRDEGFSTELNLVASAVVSYSETNNLRADLEKLRAPADGALDDVHYLLREAYRADLVHLVVSDDVPTACGFGYQMMNDSPTFADRAFSVSQRSCIGVGTTFENLLASSLGLTGDLATARRNLGAAARFRNAEGDAPGEIELVDQAGAARGGRADLRWIQDPTASWYYVAVEAAGAVSTKQWYSADEVCGADGICSVDHDASRFDDGYLWSVRGWNARGNGPWSAPIVHPGSSEAGLAGGLGADGNMVIAGVEGTSGKPGAFAASGMVESSAVTGGPVFTTSTLTDSNIHVPPNYATMAPPTVGNSYVDPVFGATVTRLTDATVLSEPAIVPEYSQTSVFNADDTYLLLFWVNNGEFHLYDAAGNHIQLINALDGLSEPRWSRSNPDYLYYHSGNKIRRIDISTMQDVVIQTFSQYSNINFGGGQGDLSDNNRITVVGNNRYVSIYNLETQTQYGVLDTNQSPINGKSFDSATVAKDGNSFIVGFNPNGTSRGNGMELFDLNGNFISQLQNATAHYAMGRDANGDAVLYTTNSPTWPQQPVGCDNGVVKINLVANPTQTCLLVLDWSMEKHLSALGSDGWVYVSTFQDGAQAVAAGPGDENDSTKWHAYTGEVFRVRGDGSVVERIVHHRSDVSTYYKQPHATISMSGKKLVYASEAISIRTDRPRCTPIATSSTWAPRRHLLRRPRATCRRTSFRRPVST